uniref:GB1/RHD3-type G domain-containing protein n=1 Tax=Eptatretus burgeri TaxID=7764 RepID=A0A8C4X0M0_EPTBU
NEGRVRVPHMPLPFIVTDSNGGLVLVEETATKLATISRPLVVVAIAGRYRSGKSFLLNRLAGFALGHTVQSKTKGLWIWPIPYPNDDSKCLVLLDTEGLGDVEKGSTQHDTWIFVLAMLLSSMLVFNTLSCIDRNSLQELRYALTCESYLNERTQKFKYGIMTDCEAYFPFFVICVRDFTLVLEVEGKSCTPDQYMEHCFHRPSTAMSKEAREYRNQLETLCSVFKKRKCFVFPLPTEPEKMKVLDTLHDTSLKRQFVKNMNDSSQWITMLLSHLLVHLARKYVKAQQDGAIPCMESTFKMVVEDVNSRACEEAYDIYQALIGEQVELPTSVSDIKAKHLQCWDIAGKVEAFFTSYLRRNEQQSLEACRRCLERLYEPIRVDVDAGEFNRPGGFESYQHEMRKLQLNYSESGNMGEMVSKRLCLTSK